MKLAELSLRDTNASVFVYPFYDFGGIGFNKLRISARQWLWIIELLELELSARRISVQINLNDPTVHKALHVIRLAILVFSLTNPKATIQ
jgi:hypothetical protein